MYKSCPSHSWVVSLHLMTYHGLLRSINIIPINRIFPPLTSSTLANHPSTRQLPSGTAFMPNATHSPLHIEHESLGYSPLQYWPISNYCDYRGPAIGSSRIPSSVLFKHSLSSYPCTHLDSSFGQSYLHGQFLTAKRERHRFTRLQFHCTWFPHIQRHHH